MTDELSIISEKYLNEVEPKEINELIDKIVDSSKENMEEICELTLECTSLLASAENRSKALSNQGVFKRIVGSLTGKNMRLQNAILQDNTNAMYAAQGVINRVMRECTNNRKLMIAVNDRVSDVYIELKENQNELAAAVLMTRQAIVSFYKEHMEEYIKHEKRIKDLENIQKSVCQNCGEKLMEWQRICPKCGAIHPLKRKLSNEINNSLNELSKIIKTSKCDECFIWNETAKKVENVLGKAKMVAEFGEIPGFSKELIEDIDGLISKCKSPEFQIAIVGVMKAGKSFLMNALMGAEIASTEVNPETAALTKFRSAKGYYVNVKFHDRKQWNQLKDSALHNNSLGESSLRKILNNPKTIELEKEWVNHSEIKIKCDDLEDLKDNVKKYTSSQSVEHLFVSEVEVGVDRSVFNMSPEVVFVDTPGLKDPVKYRSDITRKYIKKADAVLVAVPTAALTTEGNEVITTVLDCTDVNKAYIVATQKDKIPEETDHEKIVSLWIKTLVESKRFRNERAAGNRIILTSAMMDLLVNKWVSLSEEEREDPNCISDNDYTMIESYVKRVLGTRRYDINNLPYDEEKLKQVIENAGVVTLRKRLEDNLIAIYRQLKVDDIKESYKRCKKQLIRISRSAIDQKKLAIELAEDGSDALKKKVDDMLIAKKTLEVENAEIRKAAQKLTRDVTRKIARLQRTEA